MTDLGNGQYQITNTRTGAKLVVGTADLPKYGLSAPQSNAQPVQPQDQGGGFLRGASNLARSASLGIIPDAMSTIYGLLQTIPKGKYTQQDINADPFSSSAQIQSRLANPLAATGKDAAGAASWAVPQGIAGRAATGLIPRILQALAPGTVSGTLQGISQDNATPGSIGTNAALGGILPRALGLLAHPIKPFTNQVNDILANSPKNIDIQGLLSQYKNQVIPQFEKKTIGREAQQSFNDLSPNMVTAAKQFIPHIPADNMSPNLGGDITSMNIPVAGANELKRNLAGSVSKYYGGDTGKVDVESRKAMANLLREAIQTAEPGVAIPNKIASLLYKFPDAARALSYLVPGGSHSQRVIRGVGSLPFKATQLALPSSGGYLQKLLPTLYNASNQQDYSQTQ